MAQINLKVDNLQIDISKIQKDLCGMLNRYQDNLKENEKEAYYALPLTNENDIQKFEISLEEKEQYEKFVSIQFSEFNFCWYLIMSERC